MKHVTGVQWKSLFGMVLLAGLVGCLPLSGNQQAIAKPSQAPTILPTVPAKSTTAQRPMTIDAKLVEANTRFGFKLFSEILKDDAKRNVFVSPTSVALALSMTYNGASGETQEAMGKALQLQGMSQAELNRSNKELVQVLEQADSKVQLAIANSLWAKEGISFKPDFLRRNQEFYDASVNVLDFGSPTAKNAINDWVKRNTNNKIDQIVDQINPDHIMFLVNAVYFNGTWQTPFDKKDTVEQPFFRGDGTEKKHPLMTQTGQYRYAETDQFQAVSLPYGNNKFSMVIFLPKKGNSLPAFHKQLTAENWQTWMQSMRSRPGTIQVPRFKLEYETELKQQLSNLGMGVAFDRLRANFAALSNQTSKIDQVKHKTFVEVNEEGTEAAAATSVGIVATSIPLDPFTMTVDRPFICAIQHNQSGSLLFLGSIVDPQT
jgi:serpin B